MEVHYLLPVTEELFAIKSKTNWHLSDLLTIATNNINLQLFLNQQMSITVKRLKLSSYYEATLFLARTTKIISKSLKTEHLLILLSVLTLKA